MASKNLSEDPKAGAIAIILVVGGVLLVTFLVWLQAIFYRAVEGESRRKTYAEVPQQLAELRARQEGDLHSYGWVDEKAEITRIPIDRAMDLVVSDLGGGGK